MPEEVKLPERIWPNTVLTAEQEQFIADSQAAVEEKALAPTLEGTEAERIAAVKAFGQAKADKAAAQLEAAKPQEPEPEPEEGEPE